MNEDFAVEHYAEPTMGIQMSEGATLTNIHSPEKCAGRPCVIHAPSDHHMIEWPLNWRADKGLMERICPHGIGHPDPDDYAFHARNGREYMGVHGCDLCCGSNKEDSND